MLRQVVYLVQLLLVLRRVQRGAAGVRPAQSAPLGVLLLLVELGPPIALVTELASQLFPEAAVCGIVLLLVAGLLCFPSILLLIRFVLCLPHLVTTLLVGPQGLLLLLQPIRPGFSVIRHALHGADRLRVGYRMSDASATATARLQRGAAASLRGSRCIHRHCEIRLLGGFWPPPEGRPAR